MFYIMPYGQWIDGTYSYFSKREESLVKIDKALFTLNECPGYYGYLLMVEEAVDAYLTKKGEKGIKDPKCSRNSSKAFTKLIRQIDDFKRLVVSNTDAFKADPKKFLSGNVYLCDTGTYQSMLRYPGGTTQFDDNSKKVVSFILVPVTPGFVELNLVTDAVAKLAGTCGQARMFGYKFNIKSGHEAAYCEVTPSERAKLVLTVGLSGCTIVAVAANGMLRFYHEPTRDPSTRDTALKREKVAKLQEKLSQYEGTTLVRATTKTTCGSVVVVKDGKTWTICIQNHTFDQKKWEKQVSDDSMKQVAKLPKKGCIASLFRGGLPDLQEFPVPDSLELLD